MDSIRDIIPQVIEHLALKKPNSKRNIHEVWKIVAKEHAEHSCVHDLRNGFIKIHVDSSARMFSLSNQKSELLINLKKEITDLKDIIFKVGKIK